MKVTKWTVVLLSTTMVGGLLGYMYWSEVGCSTGTCAITSVWYNSTAYGGIMGYLVGGMIKDNVKPKTEKNGEL